MMRVLYQEAWEECARVGGRAEETKAELDVYSDGSDFSGGRASSVIPSGRQYKQLTDNKTQNISRIYFMIVSFH